MPRVCLSPVSAGCRARVRRPRWAAVRTAPARLPRTWPAVWASRPRTARSRTASAWSGGKVAIRARAASVATASRACWAVSSAAQAGQVLGRDGGLGRAAGGAAQVVQGAVPGDGGGPAAELVVVAGEGGQVAGDLQPGLGRDVLGVLADQGVQVAQQPRLDVAVQDPERLRIPRWARSTRPPGSSASARRVSPAGTLLPAGDVPAVGSSVRTGIGLRPVQAVADSSQQRAVGRLCPPGGGQGAPGPLRQRRGARSARTGPGQVGGAGRPARGTARCVGPACRHIWFSAAAAVFVALVAEETGGTMHQHRPARERPGD